ncbi:MAG: hypothetical protein KIT14_09950 [bacterium]|nr:hypothetical protein [bacterium]
MSTMLQIEAVKDLVEEAIDRGTTAVQRIHEAILAVPFDAVPAGGPVGDAAARVRDGGTQAVGAVYDAIRRINREIGGLASHVFEAIEGHEAVRRNVGDAPDHSTVP